MKHRILLIALAALMLASCGDAASKADTEAVSTTTTTAAQSSDNAGSADGDVAADAEIPADDAFAPADPETSSDEGSSAAGADVQDTTTTTAAASSNADTSASTTTTAPQKAASSTTTTTTTASASKKPASSTTTTTTTASKKPASSTTTTSKKTTTTTTTKKTTTTTTTTTKKVTAAPKPQTEQDKRIAEFVQRVTNGKSDKLRAVFDAVAGDTEFCYSLQPYPDLTKTNWEIQAADNMLTRGYGNCFEFAALFARSAQYLGYDVRTVDNDITTYNGNTAHHCWTELRENGKVYIIDPETHYEVLKGWLKIHRCDFYKIEYSQVPYPMNYFPKK